MRYYQSAYSTFVKKFIQTSRAISIFHEKKSTNFFAYFYYTHKLEKCIYFQQLLLLPLYSLIKINRHLCIIEMRDSHYVFVNIFSDFLYMRFVRLILSTLKQVAVLRQNMAIHLLQLSHVLNYPLFRTLLLYQKINHSPPDIAFNIKTWTILLLSRSWF